MHRNAMILMLLVVALWGCASTREEAAPVDTVAVGRLLDEWTAAWSSNDVARVLRLFTDDVIYEDVPLGAVSRGKPALAGFATGVFDGFTDLKFERKSRFVSADGRAGAIEWVFRGRQIKDNPRYTKYLIEDEMHLRYRLYPSACNRRWVLQNRDINIMFAGLEICETVLLKSGVREILFRKRILS